MAKFVSDGVYRCHPCQRELPPDQFYWVQQHRVSKVVKVPTLCKACAGEIRRARTRISPTGKVGDCTREDNQVAYRLAKKTCAAHAWGVAGYYSPSDIADTRAQVTKA